MKVYEIGYGGYEDTDHYILAGDVDISEEEFRDSVREAFREISLRHVVELCPSEEEYASPAYFGYYIKDIAKIVADKYGLTIMEDMAKVAVYSWEYEFSQQAGEALLSRFPRIDSPFFNYEYNELCEGKTPQSWALMRPQD
jgi:hypothetical protein